MSAREKLLLIVCIVVLLIGFAGRAEAGEWVIHFKKKPKEKEVERVSSGTVTTYAVAAAGLYLLSGELGAKKATVHIGSYHPDKELVYEERNLGLGLTFDTRWPGVDAETGFYLNSNGKLSVYGGLSVEAYDWGPVQARVAAGLVTGYSQLEYAGELRPLAALSLEHPATGLSFGLGAKDTEAGGAAALVTLSLRIDTP